MPSIVSCLTYLGAITMIGGLIAECTALFAMSRHGLAKNARWKVIGGISFCLGAAILVIASFLS